MSRPPLRPRSRPLSVGQLRTFEAVARCLNFRVAAHELALTQSAVSRQIQALEDEIGAALLLRHTRAVELTTAGFQLLQVVQPTLERLDSAVRQIRRNTGRQTVAVTTWASFASMWLIPRLEAFQREHPDIDIRIDATDALIDLDNSDVDLALRSARPGSVPPHALRLFGEQLAPVASPWLLKAQRPLHKAVDLAHHTLIEANEAQYSTPMEWTTWRHWLDVHRLRKLDPKRWLYLGYAYQIAQAALAGQGVALARMPLVADSLASGDLVEVLPGMRLDSPMAYWLIASPHSQTRPEVRAFSDWLIAQAALTRLAIETSP